ncbi:Sensor kinase CckA [Pseudomonas sp. MM227]|uniref:Response regulator n=1 Tax=Pseudomonas baltica TaxID=2762576 RepID=A0A7X1G6M2_9PSED|nr:MULTISPECIES: response regulator [Pseudomonas]MBC2679151.1 response regulator [Pseudomonas baltica]MBD8592499.1 response regulator [Pseudomonas sp. CFBP 8758]MBD8604288.1 response regulator [Pseudomonas sp. CFBP 8771]MBD8623297.1 response regulator [Pseudomonas sp. CFBP 13727]MBD8732366.1 response regulator [Pseudomonas sp. CFBP 13710]
MTTASILVLEDEDLIRLLLTTVLEDAGFEVTAFATADQGYDFLETHPGEVNMVVSDIRMPGHMDGYDLSKMAAERWPTLPILLTSGYSGRDLDLGPNVQFLPKPWTNERLLSKVTTSLHMH